VPPWPGVVRYARPSTRLNVPLDRSTADPLGTLHNPPVAAVLDRLELHAEAIARRMAAAARDEVAEYGAVRDPAFAAEVLAHAVEHVHAFVRAARERRPPAGAELDFVRARGARRARELMPLDALLEVYLVGQRTVWESIVEVAGASREGMRTAQELTGFTFRYTHAINVAVAEAFLRESGELASEAERRRRDLLDRLLAGGEPGLDEERRAEALGLDPHGDHVLVAATAEDDSATGAVVRALVRDEPPGSFVVARHGEVVAVLPVFIRRGPGELRASLERAAELVRRNRGVELRAGVSSVCAGLAQLARGYGEARRALRHAGCGDGAVVALDEIPLLDYLVTGADETARRLVPRGVELVLEADKRAGGALSATLHAYADCDLNVRRAAKRLVVHPNTVHYRLRRVRELSGHDPRRFEGLTELIATLRLLQA
jgi:sugar diacid utilization regulator